MDPDQGTRDEGPVPVPSRLPAAGPVGLRGRSTGDLHPPSRHEVRITPAVPVARGALFRVRVRNAGRPAGVGWRGERNWLANRREAVALNEPHMAPWWFPASDHPRDKATMDFHVTVPRGRRVIANGVLRGLSSGSGTVTWHWHAAEPMATYLAFFAVGRFTVERGVRDGLPWLIAVSDQLSPAHRDQSLRLLRRTPTVVAWLESQLGDYPFSTTGGLTTSLSPRFALENQTRPTYPWVGGPENVGLLVHELAHQWFGDDVSVHAWRDIWLNEGFATFLEARYEETHGGETAQDWLMDWYAGTPAGDDFWNQRIGEPGPRRPFALPVYVRGGMTLQALRNRVGEDDFWAVLRAWIERRGGGNGGRARTSGRWPRRPAGRT